MLKALEPLRILQGRAKDAASDLARLEAEHVAAAAQLEEAYVENNDASISRASKAVAVARSAVENNKDLLAAVERAIPRKRVEVMGAVAKEIGETLSEINEQARPLAGEIIKGLTQAYEAADKARVLFEKHGEARSELNRIAKEAGVRAEVPREMSLFAIYPPFLTAFCPKDFRGMRHGWKRELDLDHALWARVQDSEQKRHDAGKQHQAAATQGDEIHE